MTRIFVLSGGGNLGAVHVGMLQALHEVDIHPDVVIGTSVGALNGGWLAANSDSPDFAELSSIWTGLRRGQVFPVRGLLGLRGALGQRPYVVPNDGLRAIVREYLPFATLEEAGLPLHVVAAEVTTGAAFVLSSGPTEEAILASCAIPGVFPPIQIQGRLLIDGGVVDATPIAQAVAMGAREVWALPTGFSCGLSEPPQGALGMALHAVSILAGQQLARDVEIFGTETELKVVPPPCPLRVASHDFGQAADLISRAYDGTMAWLDSGCPEVAVADFRNPRRQAG